MTNLAGMIIGFLVFMGIAVLIGLEILEAEKAKIAECESVLKVHGFGEYCGCLGGEQVVVDDEAVCAGDEWYINEKEVAP